MLFTLDYFLRADHHLAASCVIAIPRFEFLFASLYSGFLERLEQLRPDVDCLENPAACGSVLARASAHLRQPLHHENGGKILTLQRILGLQSLAMTMRYAHPTPDHLQDAVRFGPVKDFRQGFGRCPA